MIPEPQEEQAALYAFGMLDADEAAEFERLVADASELREFTRDCQEATALLALGEQSTQDKPPADLKDRIMRGLDREAVAAGNLTGTAQSLTANPVRGERKIISFSAVAVPWAIAALLAVCCYLLVVREGRLHGENKALNTTVAMMRNVPAAEPFANVSLCQLEPAGEAPSTQPRATVAWDPARQQGVIQIVQLTPPAKDKDYQLWAVEDGRKDPVSAGLIRVDARGQTQTVFKPEPVSGSAKVLAFALSIEQVGGSPENAGPILFLGKL